MTLIKQQEQILKIIAERDIHRFMYELGNKKLIDEL